MEKEFPNMFINEEQLTVKKCPTVWFPKKNIPGDFYLEPKPFPNNELLVYDDVKENILFLGNCQMRVITEFCCHYLNKKIEYLDIIYDLENHSPRVDYLIKNADVIVTQPFYDVKKIL